MRTGLIYLKFSILTCCMCCMIAGLTTVNSGYAASAVVNITGNIQNNTCTVSVDSIGRVVNFGIYNARQFNSVGEKTAPVGFDINLEKCGNAVRSVDITFQGVADNQNPALVKIDSHTGTKGLGIQLLDYNRNELVLNTPLNTPLIPGNQTLKFYAQLKSTDIPVTAGNVDAVVNFVLNYQ